MLIQCPLLIQQEVIGLEGVWESWHNCKATDSSKLYRIMNDLRILNKWSVVPWQSLEEWVAFQFTKWPPPAPP